MPRLFFRPQHIITVLFLISGAVGLIYETLWAKYLSHLLGNTAHAHTFVLAFFLGGLAVGYIIIGPFSDRTKNGFRLYAYLEAIIVAFAFAFPHIYDFSSAIFMQTVKGIPADSFSYIGYEIILTAALILPPTICMGGTLPALIKAITSSIERAEKDISWLYFINSAGAVLGTLLAGFYLLPEFGLQHSMYIAGTVNAFVLVLAFIGSYLPLDYTSHKQQSKSTNLRVASPKITTQRYRYLMVAVFFSGAVALLYEVSWIRLLSLTLGSSTYAFSIMLAAFIGGIACGSLLINKQIFPKIDSFTLFALAQLGIAGSILFSLPYYQEIPYFFVELNFIFVRSDDTFLVYSALQFFTCLLLMLLPTLCLGMTLPLATRAISESVDNLGTQIGHIFSSNTAGNLVGAALTGIVLMPSLGLQQTIEVGIIINIALGVVGLLFASQISTLTTRILATTFVLLCLIQMTFGKHWDPKVLTAGGFRYFRNMQSKSFEEFKKRLSLNKVLYHKDDSSATITVVHYNYPKGDIALRVNGKPDASAKGDLSTQLLLSHLPLLLQPNPQRVLNIGLGSGITANASLTHDLERLDVVEISPAVAKASEFFAEYNNHLHKNPKLNLHIQDAKIFMNQVTQPYDVIISEPSNPWVAGIANLFSVEFYEQASSALSRNGLMAQWIHSYEMDDDTLALILRTYMSVFKHVSIWAVHQSDFILLGSNNPIQLNFERIEARMRKPELQKSLETIGITKLNTLLSCQLGGTQTAKALAGTGPTNTDDQLILEYIAPKTFYAAKRVSKIWQYDERRHKIYGNGLILNPYLKQRDKPLSADEFAEMAAFHINYTQTGVVQNILYAWLSHYPEMEKPYWALYTFLEKLDPNTDTAYFRNKALNLAPENMKYLDALIKKEGQAWMKRRSLFSQSDSAELQKLIHQALALNAPEKYKLYQQLANIHALEQNLDLALENLEKTAASAKDLYVEPKLISNIYIQAAAISIDQKLPGKAQEFIHLARKNDPHNSALAPLETTIRQMSKPTQQRKSGL
ncbi:MAG: methyltransferase [Myxococcota bacterium]|nr:methyltransferase [Myxococcota bacterium]